MASQWHLNKMSRKETQDSECAFYTPVVTMTFLLLAAVVLGLELGLVGMLVVLKWQKGSGGEQMRRPCTL